MSSGPDHPPDGGTPRGQQPQWGQQQPPPGQPPPNQPSQWGGQPQWGQQPHWNQPPQWGQPGPQGGFPGYAAPPKPGVIPLRPLGVGEILDGAFQAARKNAQAMFGSAILFQLAVVLLMGLATAAFFGIGTNIESFIQPDGMPTAAGLSFGFGLVGVLFLFGLLNSASVFVLQGALVIPVSRAVLNQPTGFRQMWSLAKGRIWPLIGLCLLLLAVGAAVLVATVVLAVVLVAFTELNGWLVLPMVLALFAAGLWVGIKIVLAPAVLVLEKTSITTSIARSWKLVRRHWWRTFGIVLLTVIIVGILTSVVTIPVQFLISMIGTSTLQSNSADDLLIMTLVTSLISTIISSLFAAVGYAFQSGVTALVYVDLRMRHEGFDVVLMKESEQLAAGAPVGPSSLPNQGQGI